MSKIHKLILLLTIVALALVAVPVSAVPYPYPFLYLCTVYEGTELAGAGKTVQAFVGTETAARASGVTNVDSQVSLGFTVDTEELGKDVSFKVDGVLATDTPDVHLALEDMGGTFVDLSYTADGVPNYTLSVTVSPSGKGTVTKNPDLAQYPEGTVVTLNAQGIGDWYFDHWGGAVSGTNPQVQVIMNTNKNVTAYFEEEYVTEASFASWLYAKFVECLID